MSYIITRKKNGLFQMYCDYSDWPLGWAAFCKGLCDLDWKGRHDEGVNLPRQFLTEDSARRCLMTYITRKQDRNELGDLNGWHYEIREYLR